MRVPAAKRIKKIDAAKAALKEGIEVPQAAVAYIAKRYGIEMHPQHFSSVKCLLKKQEQLESAANSPDATAMNGSVAPSPKSFQPATDEADLLAAMETIKPLIAALGAEKVKRIVDLLG